MELVKHIGTIKYDDEDTFVFTTAKSDLFICIYYFDTADRVYEYNKNNSIIKTVWRPITHIEGNDYLIDLYLKYTNTYRNLICESAVIYDIGDIFSTDSLKDFMMVYNREQNLNLILQ